MSRERRNAVRVHNDELIAVEWVAPSGERFQERVRCVDVSEGGVRLELPRRIEPGSVVSLRADKYHLNATARAKSAVSRGMRYHIGFEFNSGWKWRELARALEASRGLPA